MQLQAGSMGCMRYFNSAKSNRSVLCLSTHFVEEREEKQPVSLCRFSSLRSIRLNLLNVGFSLFFFKLSSADC